MTWTPDRELATPEWFAVVVTVVGEPDRIVRVDGPVTGTTVSGLRNGVEAAFTVYAITEAGSSEPSDTVAATPLTGMEGEVAGLIVGFEPGVSVSTGDQAVPGEGAITSVDLVAASKIGTEATLVTMSEALSLGEAEMIADQLEADPKVAWAEPDRFLFTSNAGADLATPVSVPDDADYASSQWNLWDTYGIGIGDSATSMTTAWARGTGEGATVAVIDTGITRHPDLDSQVVAGYDFVSNPKELAAARTERGPPEAFDADVTDTATFGDAGWDANPTDPGDWRGVAPTRDSTWHGTKVAGVIAAQAHNGEGIAGVAPGAKIQPIRALSWRGGLLSDIAASITWASGGTVDGAPVNATPADVINLSLAAETFCPTALQQAIDGARERGSVIIAAAGNANDDAANYAPGNCNGVIAVAATDRSGVRAPYSNFGERIDISAPGGNTATDGGIVTTSNTGTTNAAEATWAADQGTSYAAAHVTAVAAILKARDATLTPDDAYRALTSSAYVKDFSAATCDADHPDYACGAGILSLAQVAAACSPVEASYVSGSSVYRVVAFKATGTCEWTVPTGVAAVDYLVVAGGGSGARAHGGGGAGGMLEVVGASAPSTVVTAGQVMSVTVGGGGAAVTPSSGCSSNLTCPGAPGGDSQISGGGLSSTVRAIGGGYGGSEAESTVGGPGGSGGGGYYGGGAGTVGQGNSGGSGGGGGGAGSAAAGGGTGTPGAGRASNLVSTSVAGALGVGVVSGGSVYFAGGGAGNPFNSTAYAGGLGGGGGAGPNISSSGGNGIPNTGGGGGGGGSNYSGNVSSGAGGSGVVVLRYVAPCVESSTTSGTNKIVKFEGPGSCSWTPPSGVNKADVLVVGGGGGGGAWVGGGGGGGGVTELFGHPVSGSIAITVGAGGTGAKCNGYGSNASGYCTTENTNGLLNPVAAPGSSSSFGTVTATGGGEGGSYDAQSAGTGANGGGAGIGAVGGQGSLSGFAGGVRTEDYKGGYLGGGAVGGAGGYWGGGGAGAGQNGSAASSGVGGAGGSGYLSTITNGTYGGGGGGGAHDTSSASGAGGSGGGGPGNFYPTSFVGSDGTDGHGGGGGGGGRPNNQVSQGGSGGDGIVIVRYSMVPGEPTNPTGSAAAQSVTLSWTAPTYTGGSSVTKYTVQYSTSASFTPSTNVDTNSAATSYIVTGLVANTDYYFRVAAVNVNGTGTVSEAAGPVKPTGQPTAGQSTVSASPTSVTADGTTTSTITVTARDANGTAVPGQSVFIEKSTGPGTLSIGPWTTNASGVVTATVTSTTSGSGTFRAYLGTSASGTLITQDASVTFTAGAATAAQSTVSASPLSVTANGAATSTITVTARDVNSNVVPNQSIFVERSTGTGTLSATVGTTNSSGVVTVTVTSTTSGSGTFRAYLGSSASGTLITQSATVTFTAGAPTAAQSTVVASPSSVTANGSSASTVTVTAKDAYGNVVSGQSVFFSVTSGTGTLSSGPWTTNASGVATATITSTTAGSVTVTGYLGSSALDTAITQTGSVTLTAGAATAAQSTVVASPSSVTADGSTTSTVTITAKDLYGNVVSGQSVFFAVTSGSGTLSSGPWTTNASGVATATIRSTTAGSVTVTGYLGSSASDTAIAQTGSVTFTAGAATAAQSTVVASPSSVTANGTSSSTVTITAKDAYGNVVPSHPIYVEISSGTGTLSATTATTNSSGVATVTVTSTTAGSVTVQARLGSTSSATAITQTGSVTFTAGAPTAAQSTVVASPSSVTADGSTTSTVTITAKDLYGNVVPNQSVFFARTSGTGTLSSGPWTTNASGVATATITSTTAGSVTVTGYLGSSASDTAITQTASVTFTAGAATAAQSTVVASPSSVTANGTSSSTVTITAKDLYGNVVPSQSVFFAVTSGTGTLSSGPWATNSAGVATASITSTTAGSVTVTGYLASSASGTVITQTGSVTFTAGAATQLALTRSAAGVASGSAFTTQPQITIRDANGNTVTSDSTSVVTASVSAGGALVGTVTTTASSGIATFTNLGLSGTAGTSYTVTYSSGALTAATQSITAAVGPAASLVVTTSAAGATYGNVWTTQPVVEVRDAGGNLVTSDSSTQVTVAATGATISGTTTVTAVNGVATFIGLSLTATPGTFALTYTANPSLGAANDSLVLARASQTITFSALSAVTYGDAPFSLTASASSGLTIIYSSSDTSVCSVSGSVLTIVGAGTCTITAAQAGNTNYSAASSVTQVLTVNQAAQAPLSMTSASTAIYGQTIELATSGGSGPGALSFGVTAGTCSISGTTLTLGNAGSLCKVRAIKQSSTNYLLAQSAEQTITITQAGQTLAFTSVVPSTPLPNETYTPSATAISSMTGLSSGVTPTFTVSGGCTLSGGVVTFTATGTCTVAADAVATTNFTVAAQVTQRIEVGALNQNITFTQPASRAFGSSSFALDATASSGLTVTYVLGAGTTNAACAVSSLGVVTILAVGTCEVVAAQPGDSQYSAASQVTRAFQVVPALATAPTLTSASASSQAITVGFAAPGFTGGVAISAYRLVATPTSGGTTVTSSDCSASPCTISGLVNGTEYTVTVAAINAAGTGPASSATTPLTPATAAFAVLNLAAVPGDTVVDVSWSRPADLGGGTFTRYDLYYRVAGSGAYGSAIAITPSTPGDITTAPTNHLVTGLANGTSYDFKVVTITSANGAEIPGNTAEVVQYPSTAPSAPLDPTVLAATATDVQFSWSAPLSDGGSMLTTPYYVVTITSTSPGATTPVTCTFATVGDRFCSAANLTNGAVYTFSVGAINRMGTGTLATTTYSVPSSDATLSALEVVGSAGVVALTPAFAAATTSYVASVVNSVASVTVTPTATMPASTITVGGVAVASGTSTASIPLAVGITEIVVEVTASDPRYSETYTLEITRLSAPPAGGGAPGDVTVGIPVTPPSQVASGATIGMVLLGDSEERDVIWTRTAQNAGWQATAGAFSLQVEAFEPSGTPSPLSPNGAMQVELGGRLVINGADYLAQSEVAVFAIPTRGLRTKVRATPAAVFLGSTTVNTSGSFTVTLGIPMTMTVGDYVLQVNGVSPSKLLRSVNLQLDVDPEPVAQFGQVRKAAFYRGGSAEMTTQGRAKLDSIVTSVPAGATNVEVTVVGVSTSLDTPRANLRLARDRAQVLVDQLQARGVKGTYTVSVSTTFDVRSGDKSPEASAAFDQPMRSSTGKPLTTVTITYTVPPST